MRAAVFASILIGTKKFLQNVHNMIIRISRWLCFKKIVTSGTVASRPVNRSRKLEQASSDLGRCQRRWWIEIIKRGKVKVGKTNPVACLRVCRCWYCPPSCQVAVLNNHPVSLLHPGLHSRQDHLPDNSALSTYSPKIIVEIRVLDHSFRLLSVLDCLLVLSKTSTCSMAVVRHKISRLPPSPCRAPNIISNQISSL